MAVDLREELRDLIQTHGMKAVSEASGLQPSSLEVYSRGGVGSRTIPLRRLAKAKRKLKQ